MQRGFFDTPAARAVSAPEPEPEPERAPGAAAREPMAGGIALKRQGKYVEARPRFEAAVVACTERVGPAHERTLQSRLAPGNCMNNQEEFGPARVELEAAVEGLEAAVGEAHDMTLAARENLASLLANTDDHAAAAAAASSERVVAARTLGARHRDTLISQAKWANQLAASGRGRRRCRCWRRRRRRLRRSWGRGTSRRQMCGTGWRPPASCCYAHEMLWQLVGQNYSASRLRVGQQTTKGPAGLKSGWHCCLSS